MSKVAIFKNAAGGVSVAAIVNGDNFASIIPAGKKFKIIDRSDLPTRESRAFWQVDESILTDGVGELL